MKYKTSNYGDLKEQRFFLIRNSSISTVLNYKVDTNENCLVSFYEMPTIRDEGNRLEVVSTDRNLKDYPPAIITSGANVEDYGFELHKLAVISSFSDDGWVLEPDTNYLLVIKGTSTEGAVNVYFELEEVEESGE